MSCGIPVYGADLTVKMLLDREEATRKWLRESLDDKALIAEFEAQPTVAPDHPFQAEEGLALRFGEEQVWVHYPGPGYAPDNVVVVFPERGILFGGCLVAAGERIGNTSDANMARWGDSVRSLHRFKPEMVIPGHGERLDPGLLDHTIRLLAATAHGG